MIELNSTDIVFDLVGVDCAIANAYRRILNAEVQDYNIVFLFAGLNSSNLHYSTTEQ